jgi:hypothetical protein
LLCFSIYSLLCAFGFICENTFLLLCKSYSSAQITPLLCKSLLSSSAQIFNSSTASLFQFCFGCCCSLPFSCQLGVSCLLFVCYNLAPCLLFIVCPIFNPCTYFLTAVWPLYQLFSPIWVGTPLEYQPCFLN